jgi:hypothetical protein
MPAEKAEPRQEDPLSMLGQVRPPIPEVLDNARERLWSAVAAEMLWAGTDEDRAERRAAPAEDRRQGRDREA